jgi:hypothetical protein
MRRRGRQSAFSKAGFAGPSPGTKHQPRACRSSEPVKPRKHVALIVVPLLATGWLLGFYLFRRVRFLLWSAPLGFSFHHALPRGRSHRQDVCAELKNPLQLRLNDPLELKRRLGASYRFQGGSDALLTPTQDRSGFGPARINAGHVQRIAAVSRSRVPRVRHQVAACPAALRSAPGSRTCGYNRSWRKTRPESPADRLFLKPGSLPNPSS